MEDQDKNPIQGVERIEKNRIHYIKQYSEKEQVFMHFNVSNEKQLKKKIIDLDWENTKKKLNNIVNMNDTTTGVMVYSENVIKAINFKISEYEKEIEIRKVLAILSNAIYNGKSSVLIVNRDRIGLGLGCEYCYLPEVIEFLEKSDIFNITKTTSPLICEPDESYEIKFKLVEEKTYVKNGKWDT